MYLIRISQSPCLSKCLKDVLHGNQSTDRGDWLTHVYSILSSKACQRVQLIKIVSQIINNGHIRQETQLY